MNQFDFKAQLREIAERVAKAELLPKCGIIMTYEGKESGEEGRLVKEFSEGPVRVIGQRLSYINNFHYFEVKVGEQQVLELVLASSGGVRPELVLSDDVVWSNNSQNWAVRKYLPGSWEARLASIYKELTTEVPQQKLNELVSAFGVELPAQFPTQVRKFIKLKNAVGEKIAKTNILEKSIVIAQGGSLSTKPGDCKGEYNFSGKSIKVLWRNTEARSARLPDIVKATQTLEVRLAPISGSKDSRLVFAAYGVLDPSEVSGISIETPHGQFDVRKYETGDWEKKVDFFYRKFTKQVSEGEKGFLKDNFGLSL